MMHTPPPATPPTATGNDDSINISASSATVDARNIGTSSAPDFQPPPTMDPLSSIAQNLNTLVSRLQGLETRMGQLETARQVGPELSRPAPTASWNRGPAAPTSTAPTPAAPLPPHVNLTRAGRPRPPPLTSSNAILQGHPPRWSPMGGPWGPALPATAPLPPGPTPMFSPTAWFPPAVSFAPPPATVPPPPPTAPPAGIQPLDVFRALPTPDKIAVRRAFAAMGMSTRDFLAAVDPARLPADAIRLAQGNGRDIPAAPSASSVFDEDTSETPPRP
ncbi:hypothetical protein V8E36_007052 [Tilletia maclaganii]